MASLTPFVAPLLPHPRTTTPHGRSVTQPRASASGRTSTPRSAAAAAAAAALLLMTPLPSIDVPWAGMPRAHIAGSAALAARGGGDTFLSSSGYVNKDGESLLRWSLPISNQPVRELQSALEAVLADLKGLKWARMDQHVKRASYVLNAAQDAMLAAVPPTRREAAAAMLAHVKHDLGGIADAVQQRNADLIVGRTREVLRDVGRVEESMVSAFPFEVPEEFARLPQLRGRATVEVVVRKEGEGRFDIEGNLYREGKMTVVVDGYSAPVNAGAFVDLVSRGFYDGLPVIRSDGFIIQTGKPQDADGFVDEDTGEVRMLPLEVFAKGDKLPLYGITLEDDGRGSVGTVLPFSSYGTVAMARREFEPNTASSQFFWFLFEPDLTPAGRNLLDGAWSVFGYTTEGEKFLKGLQKGDQIVSAKVVAGIENLQRPMGKS